ncbi:MAG: zinc ribbon domain-containing protein, partial [Eubacteriales bacterium]
INAMGRAALAKKDTKYKEFIEKIDAANELIEKNSTLVKALKGNVVCQNCGAESKVGADFCGKCGAKLEKPEMPEPEPSAAGIVCPECSVENTADAAFCAGCGAKLSVEEAPAAK